MATSKQGIHGGFHSLGTEIGKDNNLRHPLPLIHHILQSTSTLVECGSMGRCTWRIMKVPFPDWHFENSVNQKKSQFCQNTIHCHLYSLFKRALFLEPGCQEQKHDLVFQGVDWACCTSSAQSPTNVDAKQEWKITERLQWHSTK